MSMTDAEIMLINKMDMGFDNIRESMDDNFEEIRKGISKEFQIAHNRIDVLNTRCAARGADCAGKIARKANIEGCIIPLKQEVKTNTTNIKWIIRVLIVSGALVGSVAGAINYLNIG